MEIQIIKLIPENNDHEDTKCSWPLDNLRVYVNRIIEMDEQGKPQFTEEAIQTFQNKI